MEIVIYTKNDCVFCEKAKELLNVNGIQYLSFELDKDFSRNLIKHLYPTAKTFPIILIDKVYIGGYNELSSIAEKEWK